MECFDFFHFRQLLTQIDSEVSQNEKSIVYSLSKLQSVVTSLPL